MATRFVSPVLPEEANPFLPEGVRRRLNGDAPESLADPNAPVTTDTSSGLSRRVRSAATNFASYAPAVEGLAKQVVGDQEGAQEAYKQYGEMQQQAQVIGPDVQTMDDVRRRGSTPQAYAEFAATQAINFAPDILATVATGGAGGAIVGGVARRAGINAIESAAKREVTKLATPKLAEAVVKAQGNDAAERLARRQLIEETSERTARVRAPELAAMEATGTKVGQIAGATVGQYPGVVADSVEALKETDAEGARKIGGVNVISAAFGSIPAERFLSRLGGGAAREAIEKSAEKFLPRVAKEFNKQGALEGGVGVGQAAIQLAGHKWVNDNVDLVGPEAFDRYLAEAVGGYFAGGAISGAHTAGSAGVERWKEGAQGRGEKYTALKERLAKNLRAAGSAAEAGLNDIRARVRAGDPGAEGAARPKPGDPINADGTPAAPGEATGTPASSAADFFSKAQAGLNRAVDGIPGAAAKVKGAVDSVLDRFKKNDEQIQSEESIDSDSDTNARQTLINMVRDYESGDAAPELPGAMGDRAPNQNPLQFETKLQDTLATVIPRDHALWQYPETAQAMMRSAEKIFTGEERTSIDDRHIGLLQTLAPEKVGRWEAANLGNDVGEGYGGVVKLSQRLTDKQRLSARERAAERAQVNKPEVEVLDTLGKTFDGQTAVTRTARVRERSPMAAEATVRGPEPSSTTEFAERSARDPSAADITETDYNDAEAIDPRDSDAEVMGGFGSGINEADAVQDSPLDKLPNTDPTSREYPALQRAAREELLGGKPDLETGGFPGGNESRVFKEGENQKLYNEKLNSASTVKTDQTFRIGGKQRSKLLELGAMVQYQRTKQSGMGMLEAIQQSVADLKLAGVEVDPSTFNAGEVKTVKGEVVGRLTPADVAALRKAATEADIKAKAARVADNSSVEDRAKWDSLERSIKAEEAFAKAVKNGTTQAATLDAFIAEKVDASPDVQNERQSFDQIQSNAVEDISLREQTPRAKPPSAIDPKTRQSASTLAPIADVSPNTTYARETTGARKARVAARESIVNSQAKIADIENKLDDASSRRPISPDKRATLEAIVSKGSRAHADAEHAQEVAVRYAQNALDPTAGGPGRDAMSDAEAREHQALVDKANALWTTDVQKTDAAIRALDKARPSDVNPQKLQAQLAREKDSVRFQERVVADALVDAGRKIGLAELKKAYDNNQLSTEKYAAQRKALEEDDAVAENYFKLAEDGEFDGRPHVTEVAQDKNEVKREPDAAEDKLDAAAEAHFGKAWTYAKVDKDGVDKFSGEATPSKARMLHEAISQPLTPREQKIDRVRRRLKQSVGGDKATTRARAEYNKYPAGIRSKLDLIEAARDLVDQLPSGDPLRAAYEKLTKASDVPVNDTAKRAGKLDSAKDAAARETARQRSERIAERAKGEPEYMRARKRAQRITRREAAAKAAASNPAPNLLNTDGKPRVNREAPNASKERPERPAGPRQEFVQSDEDAAAIHDALGKEGIPASHVSVHKFDQFNWREHKNTGEGRMVFGAGVYLSTSNGVNRAYKDGFEAKFDESNDPANDWATSYDSVDSVNKLLRKLPDSVKNRAARKTVDRLDQALRDAEGELEASRAAYDKAENRLNDFVERHLLRSDKASAEQHAVNKKAHDAAYDALLAADEKVRVARNAAYDGTKYVSQRLIKSQMTSREVDRIGTDDLDSDSQRVYEDAYNRIVGSPHRYDTAGAVDAALDALPSADRVRFASELDAANAKVEAAEGLVRNMHRTGDRARADELYEKLSSARDEAFDIEADIVGTALYPKLSDKQKATVDAAKEVGPSSHKKAVRDAYNEIYFPAPLTKAPTYQVTVNAKPGEILDFDKNLGEQHPDVQKKLIEAFPGLFEGMEDAIDGEVVYRGLADTLGSDEAASDALQGIGIVGHSFSANGGRDTTHPNYVVYDDSRIETNFVQFDESIDTRTPEQRKLDTKRMEATLESMLVEDSKHDIKAEEDMANAMLARLGVTEKIQLLPLEDRPGADDGSYRGAAGTIFLNERLSGPERVEVLMHEIGHHIIRTEIAKAMTAAGVPTKASDLGYYSEENIFKMLKEHNPELHAALRKDYLAWKKANPKSTTRVDLKISKKPIFRAARLQDNRDSLSKATVESGSPKDQKYDYSFDEYLADGIAKALTSKPEATDVVGQFFKNIADQLRKVWDAIFKSPVMKEAGTPPSIDKWIQSLFDANVRDVSSVVGPVSKATADASIRAAVENATNYHGPVFPDRPGKTNTGAPPPPGPTPAQPGTPPPREPKTFRDMIRFVRGSMRIPERKILERVLNRGAVDTRLREIYKDNPGALRLLDDAKIGLEGKIALAYFAWKDGNLTTGPEATNALFDIDDTLRSVLNVSSDGAYAQRIFDDIATGYISRVEAAGKQYSIRELEGRARGKLNAVLNHFSDFAEKVGEPLSKFWESKMSRALSSGIPAYRQFASLIQRPGGKTGNDRGFNPSVVHTTARYIREASRVFEGLNERDMHKALTYLQNGTARVPDGTRPEIRAAIDKARKLMDDLHAYAKDAGVKLPHRRNFWPVVLDLRNDTAKTRLTNLYSQPHFEDRIREIFGALEGDDTTKGAGATPRQRAANTADIPPVEPEVINYFSRLRENLEKQGKEGAAAAAVNESILGSFQRGDVTALQKHINAALKRQTRYPAGSPARKAIDLEVRYARKRIADLQGAPAAPPAAAPAAAPATGGKKKSQRPIEELIKNLVDGAVQGEHGAPTTGAGAPNFKSANYRLSQFVYDLGSPADHDTFAALQSKSPSEILSRYIEPLVKRAEYARRFGDDGAKATKLLDQMKAQGATDAQVNEASNTLKAALGTYGAEGSPLLAKVAPDLAKRLATPRTRSVLHGLQAYQNARLLPLALLSSLVDPIGIAVRTGGDFKTAWNGFKTGLKALTDKNTRADIHRLLETLGSTEDIGTLEALQQGLGGGDSPGSRKLNEFVFKYNGLQGWVRSTRYMALKAANGFMLKHAGGEGDSARYLRELGLKPGDVQMAENGDVKILTEAERASATPTEVRRDDRVRKAMMQFVDEAILRPNSQQTPLWYSDPYVGLITQYKAFGYALYDQIGGRIAREWGQGNLKVLLPALAYLPVTVAAELLRELLQHGLEGNPKRKSWGPAEYTGLAIEKQLAMRGPHLEVQADIFKDFKQQRFPGKSQIGPTATQAVDVVDGGDNLKTLESALPASSLWKY